LLKRSDHGQITRQRHFETPSQLAEDIYKAGISLLAATTRGTRYRLIGIGLSDLIDQSSVVKQGDMFSREATDRAETLERAVDDIRARFGEGIVKKGRSLS
jgi:DNA polymerase-4